MGRFILMNDIRSSPATPALRRRLCKATIVAAVMLSWSSASAFETAFWVWQRSEPLSEVERAELAAQGVRTIY